MPEENLSSSAIVYQESSQYSQKKTARNFSTHDKFGTVHRKMKIFAPKCATEITVY